MEQKLDQLKQQYFSVNYKKRILIVGLIAAVILAILWSLNVGPAKVNLSTVWKAILDLFRHDPELSNGERVIVMRVRIPRIAASMLVGVLLANSGLLMQGIFRNPLVSPYTLGVSNGAAFGASLAIVFSAGFSSIAASNQLVSVFAFLFAALTMYLVQAIGKLAKDSTKSLLLAGIAVSYLFSSLVSFIKYVVDVEKLPELVFWQMGSVSDATWPQIGLMLIVAVVSLVVMNIYAWDLNVM